MSITSRKKEQLAQRAFSRFPWFKVLAGLGGVAIALVCFYPFSSPRQQGIEVTVEKKELSLPSILQMNSQQLDDVDIGLRNMLCAQGLPGSEQMNVDACMKKLDSMALRAKVETDRNFHRFFENPAEFHHSQGYFRMLMLVTVLQQDFGAVYNPERVTPVGVFEPNARFFADSRDVFVHGLLGEGRGGTCASLPILTLAVGRRLNYPLALVSAQNHLFVRWNDEREMRNFEVSCIGLNTYPDDHYRKWPYPMTETEEKENHFLRSMSAAEEMAVFLSIRGACLMAANRCKESLGAYRAARDMAPHIRLYHLILAQAEREANLRLFGTPTGMPPDPTLRDETPEIAWILYNQNQRARRANSAMTPGIPTPTAAGPVPFQKTTLPGQPMHNSRVMNQTSPWLQSNSPNQPRNQ